MDFRVPNAETKAFLEFFDQNKNGLTRVDKTTVTNYDGEPIIRLEFEDVPPDAKYVQFVAEIEGQEARSRLFFVDVQESQPTSKRDQGLKLVGTFPAPPYSDQERRRLAEVYDFILNIGRKEERKKREQEEAKRNTVYDGLSYDERVELVFKKWQNKELDMSEMTKLEFSYWQEAMDRSSQRTDNLLWNVKHHISFLERIDKFTELLTEKENQALDELLHASTWGKDEIEQVKEMIETAQWFKKMEARVEQVKSDDELDEP